jgi:hypothetical protein
MKAKMSFAKSNHINVGTNMVMDLISVLPVEIINQNIPNEYIIIISKRIRIIMGIFLKYITKEDIRNPIKKPPVGPSIIPIPPVKFEKTGNPIEPRTKYSNKTFQESF